MLHMYVCSFDLSSWTVEQDEKANIYRLREREKEKKNTCSSLDVYCWQYFYEQTKEKDRHYNQNLVIMKTWEPRRTLVLNTSILLWHLIKAIPICMIFSTQTVRYLPLQKHWRAAWSTLRLQATEMVTLNLWPHDGQVKHSWWLRELEKRLLYTWEQKTLFSY